MVLPSDSVSKVHAEIYATGSTLRLRDLGSRNGTFLNRALVEDVVLGEGDILHFADFEFRLGRSEEADSLRPRSRWMGRPRSWSREGIYLTAWRRDTRAARASPRRGW